MVEFNTKPRTKPKRSAKFKVPARVGPISTRAQRQEAHKAKMIRKGRRNVGRRP